MLYGITLLRNQNILKFQGNAIWNHIAKKSKYNTYFFT